MPMIYRPYTTATTSLPTNYIRYIVSSAPTNPFYYTSPPSKIYWHDDRSTGGGGGWVMEQPTWLQTPVVWDEEVDDVVYEPRYEVTAPVVRRLSRHRMVLAEDAERRAEAQARAVEAQRVAEAAGKRAEGLLLAHLTEEQRRTFERNKWFVVEGGKSKRKYRIRSGSVVANIDVMEGERVTHRLCGHVNHAARVPMADHLLAQKVMLELAEDDFLRLANRHA